MFPNWINSRNNNLNFVRFLLSVMVLYTHSFALYYGSSSAEPLIKYGFTLGTLAVDCFFIISGFLIVRSMFFTSSLKSFAFSRILRIYPALFVMSFITIFIVGPLVTSSTISSYFLESNTWIYFFRNCAVVFNMSFQLPGVFLNLPYKSIVNGSVWTLPYEIRLYVLIFVVGFFYNYFKGKVSGFFSDKNIFYRLIISLSFILSVIMYIGFIHSPYLSKMFHLTMFFFAGSLIFVWSNSKHYSIVLLIILCVVLFTLNLASLSCYSVIIVASALFIFFFSYLLPVKYIPSFFCKNDVSYGMYIYAFLVQQLVLYNIPDVSFILFITASFFITFIVSVISWFLIEKYFLSIKRNLFK